LVELFVENEFDLKSKQDARIFTTYSENYQSIHILKAYNQANRLVLKQIILDKTVETGEN
jgi:hypothetical protein